MERSRLNDEQIKSRIGEIIDDLTIAVKKAARGVFDLMVEKTADSAEDLVDKGVDNLKHKIEKGCKNEDQKD